MGRFMLSPILVNRLYYRKTTDAALLQRATDDVRSAFDALSQFTASWEFIATWHKVTHRGGSYHTPVSLCLCVCLLSIHIRPIIKVLKIGFRAYEIGDFLDDF